MQRTGQRTHARSATFHTRIAPVAKTSPVEFVKQVQAETRKIAWPTRRETIMTGVMVMIMTTLLGCFFLGIDSLFDLIVNALLRLAQ
nr:preprotein translocase subunit SecE [Sphingomonas sp. S2M10]